MRIINIRTTCYSIKESSTDYLFELLPMEYCILDDKDTVDILHELKDYIVESVKEIIKEEYHNISIDDIAIESRVIERDIDWYINLRDLNPKYIQDEYEKDKDGNFKYLHEFEYEYYPLTDIIHKIGYLGYHMKKYGVHKTKIKNSIEYSDMNLSKAQNIQDIKPGSIIICKNEWTGEISKYKITSTYPVYDGNIHTITAYGTNIDNPIIELNRAILNNIIAIE